MQTLRAGRRIRGYPRIHAAQNLADNNPKALLSGRRRLPRHNRVDPRQRRSLCAQPGMKRLHPIDRPFNLNGHTIRIVADEARQSLLQR